MGPFKYVINRETSLPSDSDYNFAEETVTVIVIRNRAQNLTCVVVYLIFLHK